MKTRYTRIVRTRVEAALRLRMRPPTDEVLVKEDTFEEAIPHSIDLSRVQAKGA